MVLKPIDDPNYNPKDGQKGLKPIPRGYMPKNMSSQQEKKSNQIKKIASNLTDLSTTSIGRPKNSNGSTSGDAALNIGKFKC